MRYEILIPTPSSALVNMERDIALLQSLTNDPRCILHFYDWQTPSATYGYFIDPNHYFHLQGIKKQGLQLARRPTGGGIIFHTCDLAFSILVPSTHPGYSLNPLANYALINRAVSDALQRFIDPSSLITLLPQEPQKSGTLVDTFCMAKPTRYDVMLDGRKVGGAAQRRMKQGFLHQGTIALGLPSEAFLSDVLIEHQGLAQAMYQKSHPLLGSHYSDQQLMEARRSLRRLLIKAVRKELNQS